MLTHTKKSSLISIQDLTKEEILHILDCTKIMKQSHAPDLLKGHILGSCFFEPSTRTRLSFETAMIRLGGSVIGFSDGANISSKKGESLSDTIKMMSLYSDVIVLRHPLEGSAQVAADITDKPVINAGDGSNQHPTQTLLDLFTIKECQGSLEQLSITLAGDLKFGRTVHSLAKALIHFKPRFYFVSLPNLEMPKEISEELRHKGIKYSFHESIEEVMQKTDILYMTRLQKERFPIDYTLHPKKYHLSLKSLEKAKPNLKILHPLPRVDEIEHLIDETPYAYYFEQAENGIYTRQALLALALDKMEI